MPELAKLILLFVVGSIAGIINVNAGGGSSVTLPALIFLGLEGTVANGTNRIGILAQNILAISSFRRRQFHAFRESLTMALFTLPGAVAGALLSVRISHAWFLRILSVIMIGIVFSILFGRPRRRPSETDEHTPKWLLYPVLTGIGFYGGFMQIGVGFMLMAALYHLLRISLVRVNMHKVFIVCIYTLPALLVFVITGNVNWVYGLFLACGMAFGAWWGAHIAVKGGEKAIRAILAVAILIMALKLMNLF